MEHEFTANIKEILVDEFGSVGNDLFTISDLIQYLNNKTRSASRGSKSRGSFANLYAIYVLVEDYLNHEFDSLGNYDDYEGAQYSDLLRRMRDLPFGDKLQNHALNHRLNQEFRRLFPQQTIQPIIRDTETSRYWLNENLLSISINNTRYNLARSIIKIIDAYIQAKQGAFKTFIVDLENLQAISKSNPQQATRFILSLLHPTVDARIFEIVSYAILRAYYHQQVIYWGWSLENINEESLTLYKTGRTNANDGGIDFVMKPLGRFFQVTETTDVHKFFLDIDKVLHYPITFVIKSAQPIPDIKQAMRLQAEQLYPVKMIVNRYMSAIEEIINIPQLTQILNEQIEAGNLLTIINEILLHSKLEFHYSIDE